LLAWARLDMSLIIILLGCYRMTFIGGGRACIGFKFAILELSASRIFRYTSSILTYLSTFLSCLAFYPPTWHDEHAEAILTTLLEAFEFSPTSQTVGWQFNGVTQPVVHDPTAPPGTSPKIMLPVKASLAQPRS
jgi:hypothetical protein